MNTAFSLLSAAVAEESQGAIDRMNSYIATDDLTVAQQQIADPDYWSSVGILTLTGLLVVFVILGLLIFLFWLMGTIFKNIDKNKAEKAKLAAAEAATAAASTSAEMAEVVEEYEEDDNEIVAVISAAIAAYSAEDGKNYTIKSIKRRDSRVRSAWSLAGIGENTRPF